MWQNATADQGPNLYSNVCTARHSRTSSAPGIDSAQSSPVTGASSQASGSGTRSDLGNGECEAAAV